MRRVKVFEYCDFECVNTAEHGLNSPLECPEPLEEEVKQSKCKESAARGNPGSDPGPSLLISEDIGTEDIPFSVWWSNQLEYLVHSCTSFGAEIVRVVHHGHVR